LAQEFVNRYRKQKRLVSLEEQAEDGVQFRAADHQPLVPADNRLELATDEALAGLAPADRLVLAAYYLDDRTLTEIGKIVGVHESTISRRLEKMLKSLRKQIMVGLQARGMDRSQALETDVRYIMVDVKRKLQETPSQAFHGKGSD
jgi:RNA polymerase sigma-70 factor (ECF subfamily)